MSALSQVEKWEVATVAAATFGTDGTHAAVGPVDRPFALASVSKVLASLAVMVAVEEAVTDLDAPAGPTGSTLRHLLGHASGLAPDGTILGRPGTRRIYSNAGFEIIGEHVANAAAMPFDRYVAAALVEPFGLTSTDVAGSPAHAYSSSVSDLVTILAAALDGTLLAPVTQAAWTTPCFAELGGILPGFGRHVPNPWGLGVEVRGTKARHWTGRDNSAGTWGHFGLAGTFVWFDPAIDTGLVVLTDRVFDTWAIEAWPPLSDAVVDEVRTARDRVSSDRRSPR